MAKGNRGGQRRRKANSSNGSGYQLKDGEEVFARSSPTSFNKQGEILIIKNADGDYVYKGFVGDYKGAIDKNSSDYKYALSSSNVKSKFKSDGSVEVVKGGLFDRKKTFKNTDDFQKEVNKRLDYKIQIETSRIESIKKGILPFSQVEAENYKTIIRSNVLVDAKNKIAKELQDSIKNSKIKIDAYQNMKSRFNVFIEGKKK